MFEYIIIILLVLFAIGGIWSFVVSKKVKEEGIETEAVISRVETVEWHNADWPENNFTEEYYITYINQKGQTAEALLSNPGSHRLKKGDKIIIKYLPDKQDYPVLIKVI